MTMTAEDEWDRRVAYLVIGDPTEYCQPQIEGVALTCAHCFMPKSHHAGLGKCLFETTTYKAVGTSYARDLYSRAHPTLDELYCT